MSPSFTEIETEPSTKTMRRYISEHYNLSIPFYESTYDDVKKIAEGESKYLIVYLHCPTHENTSEFITNVLANDEVLAHFAETAILWSASVMDSTGYILAHTLHAETFPFIAVLFQREVALRIQGFIDKDKLITSWKKCTEVWDGVVAQAISNQAERRVIEQQRNTEEAADEAMELADIKRLAELEQEERAKAEVALRAEQEMREQEERRHEEDRTRQEAQLEKERKDAIIKAAQERALSRLQPEPAAESCDSVVHLALRCPSGKVHRRRFGNDELVDRLYDFAMTLDEFNGGEIHLISGVPPKRIVWESKLTTFAQIPELYPRATVNVRYLASRECNEQANCN